MLTPKETGGSPAYRSAARSVLLGGPGDYLAFTPAQAGDRRKWTFHTCWKPSYDPEAVSDRCLLSAGINESATARVEAAWHSADTFVLLIYEYADGAVQYAYTGTIAADQTAHQHLTVAVDTTHATASERVKAWINGVGVPLNASTTMAQDHETVINTPVLHTLGCRSYDLAAHADGYYSNTTFIDGQALDGACFGESSERAPGFWTDKAYAGDYGTNGWRLDFEDAADPGRDASGNGNDWTVVGSPLQTLDTPANNHCTINPHTTSTLAVSGGNLSGTGVTNTAYYESWPFTFILGQGKWWFRTRLTWTGDAAPGFSLYALSEYRDANGGYCPSNLFHFSRTTEYHLAGEWYAALKPSFNIESGSVVDILLDFDHGAFTALDDGVLIGTIDISPILGSGPFILDWADLRNVATGYSAVELDFGATGSTPPAGYEDYLPICAANLPDGQADVLAGTYTGNGSAGGPFVWSNCALDSVTIGSDAFANDGSTDAVRFFSNGFKPAYAATHNSNGTTYAWTATKKSMTKYSNAQEG